jgi:hypothetical protein
MASIELRKAADARNLIGYIIGTGSTSAADVERMQSCVSDIDAALASTIVSASGLPTQDMADAASLARHWLSLRQSKD